MGQAKTKEPEKPLSELIKEFKKGIDRMIRDFKREIMRLEMDSKKIKKDIEKMVKNKEPKSSQRIMAQNYLKKQNMVKKYKGLEAKMEGVKIQLANIATTQTLVDTMKGVAGMLNKTSESVNVNNIQHIIQDFNVQMDKQQAMGDMMEDAMDMGEEDIDDADADKLIDDIENGIGGGGKKQAVATEEMDDFSKDLAELKK